MHVFRYPEFYTGQICKCNGRTVCKVQINWENRVKILIFDDFSFYALVFILASKTYANVIIIFKLGFCIVGSLEFIGEGIEFIWLNAGNWPKKHVLFKIQFSNIQTMSNKKQCDPCTLVEWREKKHYNWLHFVIFSWFFLLERLEIIKLITYNVF